MTGREPTSIFLIGMMASGKTTVGRRLAEHLGWKFYDADRELEERCGVPISYIFEKEGEAGFRARETQMLAELTALDGVVVSTGGGAPMFEINRKLLRRGLVIQLSSSISDIIERTRYDTARPLLATEDRAARIRAIMLERGPVYDEACDEKVVTSRRQVDYVVKKILEMPSVRAVAERAGQKNSKGERADD
jgi:shikimate kinase